MLAVALVLASAASAFALQVWPGAENPQSNPAIPVGSAGRVVFSLRNTGAQPVTVTFTGSGTNCGEMTSPVPLDPLTPTPWTIPVGQQMQFTVGGSFGTAGDKFCSYTPITDPPTVSGSASVTFHVAATADLDAQPTSMNFGTRPQSGSESQTIAITSWAGASNVTLTIANDTMSRFSINGGACAGSSCTVALPGGGSFGSASVTCTGSGSGFGSAQLLVFSGATQLSQVELLCDTDPSSGGYTLSPDPLLQTAPVGMTVTDPIAVTGSGALTTISLTGSTWISIVECPTGSCVLAPGTTLPTELHATCAPTAQTTEMATLSLSGDAGSGSAMIVCTGQSSGAGVLAVSPSAIDFDPTPVNGQNSASITITNTGDAPLTNVVLSLAGAGGAHFRFEGCDAIAPCEIATSRVIPVHFEPLSHGPLMTQLTITADGLEPVGSGSSMMIFGVGSATTGPQSAIVSLSGTGLGGVQVVTSPSAASDFHLPLGTLPLSQVGSAEIVVRNDGNQAFLATITGAAAPYSLPTSTSSIGASSATTFNVFCSSDTPSVSNDQTWTVSSDAYFGSPRTITVSCAIADTNVIVDPLAFDFGEVRVGTIVEPRTLTVTNPGPLSATIASLGLRVGKPGLSLTPSSTMTTLAVGSSTQATLSLATTADTDLTDEFVDIAVGSATLNLPVRGKVVTPHSRVAPAALDLGTACVGSPVSGMVQLVNDGTATLSVEAPLLDNETSFTVATPGVSWPASLPAGLELTAEITPLASVSGTVTSTLVWRDDVPSVYEVPITLEYVTSGTALSPRGLDFGSIPVDDQVGTQRITLENCDDIERTITIKSIRGLKGPIGAWILDPQIGFTKTLLPKERQAVLVTFDPTGRGHYEAEIIVETESGTETILLIGDATGREFGTTSFYSCVCNAPGVPWQGWPIALAIVVVSVRRRRGSSSPR